jgi:transglutaminase-like putative cysteine protease
MMRILPILLILSLLPAVLAYEIEYGGATPEYEQGVEGPGFSPWGPENTTLPPSSDQWNIPSGENQVPPESPAVLFTVEPAQPVLFMKIESADYYTGTTWLKTTESSPSEPERENAPYTLYVEFQAGSEGVFSLPVASSGSKVFGLTSAPATPLQLLQDSFAGTFRVSLPARATLRYATTYRFSPSPAELEKVTWEDLRTKTPAEIRDKCLQLPLSLPQEVKQVAQSLKDPSLGPYRQAMKVVEYLKTGFTYGPLTQRIERDAALTYLQTRQGHCFHANTTLAVLLRCLDIPARMVFGYHPKEEIGGKLLYKPPGHAQVEAYFPPYGWVYLDATPPGEGPSHLPLDDPAHTYNPPESEQPAIPKPVLEFNCQETTKPGENVTFFVRLTYLGKPLTGKTVQILDTSSWRILATPTTGTGFVSASYFFPRTERVGIRYLTAIFREGSLTAENTRSLLVQAGTTPHLTLLNNVVRRGEALRISGKLLDEFGQGIPNQILTILVDNSPIASVVTDNRGEYSLELSTKNLKPGLHNIQASFDPPVQGYVSSKSSSQTFEVTEGESKRIPWLYILAAPAIILPMLILFRKKKAESAPLPSASVRKLLEEFASAKRYRDGVIAAYHQFLGMLVGSGKYEVRVNQTAREIAEDLAKKFGDFPLKDFESFVEVYEKAMFSEKPITKEDFEKAVEGICSTLDKMHWG